MWCLSNHGNRGNGPRAGRRLTESTVSGLVGALQEQEPIWRLR